VIGSTRRTPHGVAGRQRALSEGLLSSSKRSATACCIRGAPSQQASHDKKFDVIVGAITMLLVCSAKVAAV